MVPRSTPDSRIHTKSVAPDSASGSPDEKPRNMTISTRGLKYTASASKTEGRGCAVPGEAVMRYSPASNLRIGAGMICAVGGSSLKSTP